MLDEMKRNAEIVNVCEWEAYFMKSQRCVCAEVGGRPFAIQST